VLQVVLRPGKWTSHATTDGLALYKSGEGIRADESEICETAIFVVLSVVYYKFYLSLGFLFASKCVEL